MTKAINQRKKRLSAIVEMGNDGDFISRGYDILSTLIIFLNLGISIALTFDQVEAVAKTPLETIEWFTYAFFAIDFFLRFITSDVRMPDLPAGKACIKYLFSFMGIVDLMSFLPYFLPVFFPEGAVAFRMIRVARIFRLFRINAYYDSLNVIAHVLVSKKQQLLSSFFIILIMMVASSLCMYSLEHEAQPEVFKNAFSGIWWSVSTLLTVGYGDIYPITPLGQVFSIIITFLGVLMVAIPTGIISAGFVDQYSRVKRLSEYGAESEINFVKFPITEEDPWNGKKLKDLNLPTGLLVAAIKRRNGIIVPRGDVVIENGDVLVLGADTFRDDQHIELKKLTLQDHNPWIGQRVDELDISRKTLLVLLKREDSYIVPKGDMILQEKDQLFLYTQRRIMDAQDIVL